MAPVVVVVVAVVDGSLWWWWVGLSGCLDKQNQWWWVGLSGCGGWASLVVVGGPLGCLDRQTESVVVGVPLWW